jgi:membrane-associated phospholipid phosphatase
MISLSRVALGLHYPSDVVAGMLVGWTAAVLVTGVARPLVERVASAVGRLSDPLLAPVWIWIAQLLPTRREREKTL